MTAEQAIQRADDLREAAGLVNETCHTLYGPGPDIGSISIPIVELAREVDVLAGRILVARLREQGAVR